MSEPVMLTTIDNPYNPFVQYDQWYHYDRAMGYFTPEYLARIAKCSSSLSDEQNDIIEEAAMDDIIRLNLTGNYKKVRESDFKAS